MLASCTTGEISDPYDRAGSRQLYDQDLQQKQFMSSAFGRYGGMQLIDSAQDLYAIPPSR